MSSGPPTVAPRRPEIVTDAVPERRQRWIELATSGDHKDVGRIYVAGALSFMFLAALTFLLMRIQLIVPDSTLIDPVIFDRLLTINGATTVFLFALPLAFGLYTFLVPLQIGARQLAFPRLGQFGLWLYLAGGIGLYATFLYTPPDTGFNPLPPLSDDAFSPTNGVDAWITVVGAVTLGLTLQAINLLTTLRRLRAPGMAWRRLPMLSWAATASSAVLLVAGPALLAALTMLEIDRQFEGVFFDPGEGGAPIYFQHLSWLFFTGAWLIVVLLAIGVISEILPPLTGSALPNRGTVAAAMGAIGGLGVLAWMQNMLTAPIPVGWLYMAMAASVLLIVPIGLVALNWSAMLVGGALQLRAPLLFALAAISTLAFGLPGELGHSVIPVAWQVAGSTDATANTGYVLIGGAVLGGLAALHFWFPKMTGRLLGESLGKLSLLLILAGVHLTFAPLFFAGMEGQPVDVYKFYEGEGLDGWNLVSTLGSIVLFSGISVALANALLSVSGGRSVGPDPWGADTLEWFAPSPPPVHNFDVLPDVRSARPLRDVRDAVRRAHAPAPGRVLARAKPRRQPKGGGR